MTDETPDSPRLPAMFDGDLPQRYREEMQRRKQAEAELAKARSRLSEVERERDAALQAISDSASWADFVLDTMEDVLHIDVKGELEAHRDNMRDAIQRDGGKGRHGDFEAGDLETLLRVVTCAVAYDRMEAGARNRPDPLSDAEAMEARLLIVTMRRHLAAPPLPRESAGLAERMRARAERALQPGEEPTDWYSALDDIATMPAGAPSTEGPRDAAEQAWRAGYRYMIEQIEAFDAGRQDAGVTLSRIHTELKWGLADPGKQPAHRPAAAHRDTREAEGLRTECASCAELRNRVAYLEGYLKVMEAGAVAAVAPLATRPPDGMPGEPARDVADLAAEMEAKRRKCLVHGEFRANMGAECTCWSVTPAAPPTVPGEPPTVDLLRAAYGRIQALDKAICDGVKLTRFSLTVTKAREVLSDIDKYLAAPPTPPRPPVERDDDAWVCEDCGASLGDHNPPHRIGNFCRGEHKGPDKPARTPVDEAAVRADERELREALRLVRGLVAANAEPGFTPGQYDVLYNRDLLAVVDAALRTPAATPEGADR